MEDRLARAEPKDLICAFSWSTVLVLQATGTRTVLGLLLLPR